MEYSADRIIYLWDYDYHLKRDFPCLEFEIYKDDFSELLGKQIYPLSDVIKPIIIDRKAKWAYLKKVGAPGHLEIEEINFDKLIEKFRNAV